MIEYVLKDSFNPSEVIACNHLRTHGTRCCIHQSSFGLNESMLKVAGQKSVCACVHVCMCETYARTTCVKVNSLAASPRSSNRARTSGLMIEVTHRSSVETLRCLKIEDTNFAEHLPRRTPKCHQCVAICPHKRCESNLTCAL